MALLQRVCFLALASEDTNNLSFKKSSLIRSLRLKEDNTYDPLPLKHTTQSLSPIIKQQTMQIAQWAFLILWTCSVPSKSAPFLPREGFWELPHDRNVDPPVQVFNARPEPFQHDVQNKAKRSVNYSVVQVDGSSTANVAATVIYTVTQPASVLSVSSSKAAAVVTTTELVSQTASASTSVMTTTVASSGSDPVSVSTDSVVSTVTAAPTSSTSYYDDGLWHTYYPVKNFQPPWSTSSTIAWTTSTTGSLGSSSSTVYARAPAGTGSSSRHALGVAIPGAAYPSNRGWTSYSQQRSQEAKRGVGAWKPLEDARYSKTQPRKVPTNLKLASWNITAT
ncbi:MAG: hypothetical protein M1828_001836 [Chrysothrix sp. TS-e1954]|nr:MAG: hypothetical protein M1828_001836 [Chrysothrix sp. TS-e1954]